MLELLLALMPGAPLLAALALFLAGMLGRPPGERAVNRVAAAGLGLGLLGALGLAAARALDRLPRLVPLGVWLRSGEDAFRLDLLLDRPGLALLLLGAALTGIVARFSAGYLHREPGYARFFATLCLFLGALGLLCLADDAVLAYAGWEGVGLCSTLLIGFFRERPAAAAAGTRAFVTNRVGDAGFLLALLLALAWIGDTRWSAMSSGADGLSVLQASAIGGGLLLAAMAKGGLVPLSPWLHRAMEGPTPSSALFYGGVAVHGGVLLLLRAEAIFAVGGPAALVAVGVGLCTALYGWLVGLAQTDAKSALVSSSMAHVGLMVVWCGMGWTGLALAHLVAHALVRCWQILRAPSVVAELTARPTRPVSAALANSRTLYVAALSRFWLDELSSWAVVVPLRRLGLDLDAIDARFVDRATGLPLRRAFTGLASWRPRGEQGAEFAEARGVVGRLAQWTAAALATVEDRLVLRAIGQGLPEAGGRLGAALMRVELLLARPWVVALIVLFTLLLVW